MKSLHQTIIVNGKNCIFKPLSVCIIDSYSIPYRECEEFCEKLAAKAPLEYKRSARSWCKELIARKMMYDRNLFVLRTMDTELDDYEPLYKLAIYNIFYFIYRIKEFWNGRHNKSR